MFALWVASQNAQSKLAKCFSVRAPPQTYEFHPIENKRWAAFRFHLSFDFPGLPPTLRLDSIAWFFKLARAFCEPWTSLTLRISPSALVSFCYVSLKCSVLYENSECALSLQSVSVYVSVFVRMYMHGERQRHYRKPRGKAITQRAPCWNQSHSDTSSQTVISFSSRLWQPEKLLHPLLLFSFFSLADFTVRFTAGTAEVKEKRHKNQFLYPLLSADLAGSVMTDWELPVCVDGSEGMV